MNKAQFIEMVQASGSYKTKVEAELAIKAFTEAITTSLVKKEEVNLVGFGSFTTVLLRGKTGKVPGTDRMYTTQDKIIPKFKAAKALRERTEMGE